MRRQTVQTTQTTQNRRIRRRAGLASAAVLLSAATVVTASGTGNAAGGEAAKPTEEEIAALFDEWNDALQSGDPEQVADRYASDAVLLPTASSRIRTSPAEITDYFEHFQENDPVGEKTRTIVDVLDRNSAIDAGTYVFTLTDHETGEVSEVQARYTYAYEKIDGEWLIVNHHSSVTPAEG